MHNCGDLKSDRAWQNLKHQSIWAGISLPRQGSKYTNSVTNYKKNHSIAVDCTVKYASASGISIGRRPQP